VSEDAKRGKKPDDIGIEELEPEGDPNRGNRVKIDADFGTAMDALMTVNPKKK
jgi:hypothetical protein